MVCEKKTNSLKKKAHPPFNIGSKSRVQMGLHPKLFPHSSDSPPIGSYCIATINKKCHVTRSIHCVVFTNTVFYEKVGLCWIDFGERCIRKNDTINLWTRQQETEEFSATLGGRRLNEQTEEKSLLQNESDPGLYDLPRWPESCMEKCGTSVKRDVSFGTVPRFTKEKTFSTPGPGYVRNKEHNPYYYIEEKRYKGLSPLPSFEYDGSAPRGQKQIFSLPPNRYNTKHPDCMDNRLKKVTSKRGPYDLFTGPRDDTTIKGYFSPPQMTDNSNWPMKFPGEIDKLLDDSNYFKGLWRHGPRFSKKPTLRFMLTDISLCYKDPSQPAPGHYNVDYFPGKPKNAKSYPFGVGAEIERLPVKKEILPWPGRYNPQRHKNIEGRGWTWVFKSKAPRSNWAVQDSYNSF